MFRLGILVLTVVIMLPTDGICSSLPACTSIPRTVQWAMNVAKIINN
jgi:hypothetical protein